MLAAAETHQVAEDLWVWQRYQPSVKVDCSSAAVRIGAELIFIDPIPLDDDPLRALVAQAKPTAIILTSANHDRAATKLSERFSIPILATAETAQALTVPITRNIADGELLSGSLRVVAIPGAAIGEIALHDSRGWLLLGDALIHLEPEGLTMLPAKYCTDASELRSSLRKLLRFDFQILTFAHGLPLVSRARLRLEALLA